VAAPDARSGGVGGQGSLVHLDGWTVEEMLIEPSVGMIVNWPTVRLREFDRSTFSVRERTYKEAKEEYDAHRDSLSAWMEAARQYVYALDAGATVERDLKLEALGKVVGGTLPLLVTANTEREINDAVAFAEEEGARIVILGGSEAWKVVELLAEKHVPVILGPTQGLPSGEDERYDERYTQPAKLHAAGVTFAISTFNASSSRTLPYEAGTAVPHGLAAEEALKAITLYPAQILGVAGRLGTIERGKLANLIVTNGDPLEIRTQMTHLVIRGREVSLVSKHEELYRKYKARP
jgi:imidazolonepropionase-like amidohydrolase